MEYVSTRNTEKNFTFKEVFLRGLAPDGGLFVPKKIPKYSFEKLEELRNLSYKDLATEIIIEFCNGEFDKIEIKELINASYKNFGVDDIVLIKKIGKANLLELFHGPTLAFKDIAMQVIGNMYEKILEETQSQINIVVATSGDTGAAAISATKNRKNMKIFVLHPYKKISEVQRKFMTTVNSKNVFNIALDANFDDCQNFVKLMFADKKFSSSINMSAVNSINWSRIIFQIVYYFFAYFKGANQNDTINFSVPTGNFGDIYAGYIAKKMGLPINNLIIATNENDILKRVIRTGKYKPQKVKHTISPSMDIQVASNFERLIFDITNCDSNRTTKLMNNLNNEGEFELKSGELKKIQENFCSESLSEKETISTINKVYKDHNIIVDPHTAVGIGVVEKIPLLKNIVILATAHPAKFSQVVKKAIGFEPELPENLKHILNKEEKYDRLPNNLDWVKKYIFSKK